LLRFGGVDAHLFIFVDVVRETVVPTFRSARRAKDMARAKAAAAKVVPLRKTQDRPDLDELIDAFDEKLQRMDQDQLNDFVGAYITIEINDVDSACIDAGWSDDEEEG
jgi:hypothetical protein